MQKYTTDVVVIGAGLAGLVTALELVKQNKGVILVDSQDQKEMGGLANWAFGGMALVDTPEQRSKGITDNPQTAYSDWCRYAEFNDQDIWPKAWAKYYVEHCIPEIYEYIRQLKVKFIPTVNWPERGADTVGNSIARYHILWGCSRRLVSQLTKQLDGIKSSLLSYHFNCRVNELVYTNGVVTGCRTNDAEYQADAVVIATGGFGGNLHMVEQHWPEQWSPLSQKLLNGCDPSNDGQLMMQAGTIGAQVTYLDRMWNYAAGIPHPQPRFKDHGLSLVPCRSAVWLDHTGQRISPPAIGGQDTVGLVHQINELQGPYSWQIFNKRIALKELAISGSEHNPAIRDRKILRFAKEILLGNHALVNQLADESSDFITANSLDHLIEKMKAHDNEQVLDPERVRHATKQYDEALINQDTNDAQVKNILDVRSYLADRLRTATPKSIIDNPPLIAVKLRTITRKSMGGLVTNLNSQVLDQDNNVIPGLLAVGEVAGFGGGGASGKRSLEGTFLPGCILTGRQAARTLV